LDLLAEPVVFNLVPVRKLFSLMVLCTTLTFGSKLLATATAGSSAGAAADLIFHLWRTKKKEEQRRRKRRKKKWKNE
jgi:hypothetical protein